MPSYEVTCAECGSKTLVFDTMSSKTGKAKIGGTVPHVCEVCGAEEAKKEPQGTVEIIWR